MKKIMFYSTILVLLLTTTALKLEEVQCVAADLKNELMPVLKPEYKYDSSKITRVLYKKEAFQSGVEVPLFMGEKYRFVFNTAGLPKDIEINIFDKKPSNKMKNALFTLSSVREMGKNIYTYEPEKSKKMYIVYTIPATEEEGLKGCVVFLLGYKL
ncbi:MAG TPA: hypothetical protein VIN73_09245 [Vicingaceae bacterium]